jgi:hypothetical protein
VAEPCPTEELPAEDAAVDPELADAAGDELTEEEAATVPEYPLDVVPMVG